MISRDIIEHPSLDKLWEDLKIQKNHVAKIAVGPKFSREPLNDWESILSEIIIGDTFGADRIDYLLRDSYHAGVAYGRFDHYRLIDTLRILPKGDVGPPQDETSQIGLPWYEAEVAQARLRREQASKEPTLGIESGGLQAAEGLLWARYFMWSQVYLHHVRRVYDLHLADFLGEWLPSGMFSVRPEEHLLISDNEVLTAIADASRDPGMRGHESAFLIASRMHFRRIYEANPTDRRIRLDAFEVVSKALTAEYSSRKVKVATIRQRSEGKHFPVLTASGSCESSINLSETLAHLPVVSSEYVFVHPQLRDEARDWLLRERRRILVA
jgi:HD superfamily phosphohydrolase